MKLRRGDFRWSGLVKSDFSADVAGRLRFPWRMAKSERASKEPPEPFIFC